MTHIFGTWGRWVNGQQPSSASHQRATIHLHSISPQSIGQHYCRYLTTAAGPEIESPGVTHCPLHLHQHQITACFLRLRPHKHITVTSHECHGIWKCWQLNCLFNRGSLTAHCTSINTKLLPASWGSDHISHYSDCTCVSLLLKSLVTQLFVQQFVKANNKYNITAQHNCHFMRESKGNCWIPHTKGQ